MTLYKNKYRIETTRLKNWDYSSNGYYYITICTKNREHIFGKIAVETGFKPVSTKKSVSTMILNEYGKIVEKCWYDLSEHYSNLKLDEFVIMPNHIHGIMIIDNNDGNGNGNVETGFKPVSTNTTNNTGNTNKQHGLFEFVRALKTFSSRRINEFRNSPGAPVWQSRFHDRIVRDENELNRIREYIQNNPINWETDDLNMEVS
jgi:REP element-mobilizing transposase RayT